MGVVKKTSQRLTRLQALQWLERRSNFEQIPTKLEKKTIFTLSRMAALLKALGNPQRQFPSAHLAGTKGKGSTAAMLAAIVQSAGYRVGCYLSPHVDRIEERISIAGRQISTADLLVAFRRIMPVVERLDQLALRKNTTGPTWFEVLTAIAFIHFEQKGIDLAVIETGLGGRLDATNLCSPVVSLITNISLDHTDVLGNTIRAIAIEKAGIIRRSCPVISTALHPDAMKVISKKSTEKRTKSFFLNRDFTVRSLKTKNPRNPTISNWHSFEIQAPPESPAKTYRIAMAGIHQAENAAAAIMATKVLAGKGFQIDKHNIATGLRKTRLPARIEWISYVPPIILDAAHNVASMDSLVKTLSDQDSQPKKRILIFAASADKELTAMLRISTTYFTDIVLTRYATNPRAATITRLREAAKKGGWQEPHVAVSPTEAVLVGKRLAGKTGLLCVAGSFFLAAEVRNALA
ncbi:MAG: bifunctional folylpolyglutamate synthase/dihydrofolate synthase [Planctomycetaceae bacterium]|nr:bifunctional folylpolyglutamate synthase/dihydrofolate synthase [Planctomycetaceae bacterium]MBT6919921.1 bifunctional folylpolyglutamate synthase/dihydrofolate synthase [Planctomycetaceae bacterium]